MPKSYRLDIASKAQKELDDVPSSLFSKIDKQIKSLAQNPRPFGVKKLDNELYRIRIGNFRVIYAILEKFEKVVILRVVRRSEKTYRGVPP